MKNIIVAASITFNFASACYAQAPLTDEATLQIVSAKLLELQESNQRLLNATNPNIMKRLMIESLETVHELQAELAESRFIKVRGFAVTAQGAISVDLEYIEEQ
ncbi:hypothetical protein ASD54_21640 [Rhizobium sp. Root149]|uniref:hypothetical protein n=1 Tax=Rhizobium sp. Root149 TaxID=1736473 RepID=UPI0007123DE4|nr:hypothetical protein [Rhizobium sp. Root149]KQZ46624.1 hypothetical protein ASD54_21640 [Rhizobium sp. Root149]